jgi:O-antigen/teichoic acid export membrane protein
MRAGHELFWVCTGQALGAAGSIAGVRLLTQSLSPTVYGELALGLTAATLANQVLLGPLGGAALRFFAAAKERSELSAYFEAVRWLLTRASLLLVAATLVVSLAFLMSGRRHSVPLLLAAVSYALLFSVSSVLDGMQNAARQRIVVAWHDGLGPWLRFATAVALVRSIAPLSSVAMAGYAIAAAAVLGSQTWFFRRRILALTTDTPVAATAPRRWREQMIGYARPFTVFGVFTWVQVVSDRWALEAFAGTHAVGEYAVLFQLGYYPVTMGAAMLMQLVTPVLFDRAGDASSTTRMLHSRRLNNQLVVAAFAVTAVMTTGAFAAHRAILGFVAAPAYRTVSSLLPWLVLAAGLFAAGQVATLGPMSANATKRLLWPKIISSTGGIALNVIGARLWGVQGVVGAAVAYSIVYVVWGMYLLETSSHSAAVVQDLE